MLKSLISNNLMAVLIHILIVVLMWVPLVINNGHSLGPVCNWIWAWMGLGLYIAVGFFLTGNFLIKHEKVWLNFLSVSLMAMLGLTFCLHSITRQTTLIPGLEWIIFEIGFPFCQPFNPEGTAYFVFALTPSALIWVGMEFKVKMIGVSVSKNKGERPTI